MLLRIAIQTGILLLTLPMIALAGAVLDTDGDLVPDQFDNCSHVANGPNQTTNQVDTDLDGYGNRCDSDLNNDCATTASDFGIFLATFGTTSNGITDCDGNGTITAGDFGCFLAKFSGAPGTPANAPGPSGLVCARCGADLGTTPCLP